MAMKEKESVPGSDLAAEGHGDAPGRAEGRTPKRRGVVFSRIITCTAIVCAVL